MCTLLYFIKELKTKLLLQRPNVKDKKGFKKIKSLQTLPTVTTITDKI